MSEPAAPVPAGEQVARSQQLPESIAHAQARIAHYRNVLRRAGQEIERRLERLDRLAAAVGQANEPTAVLQEALIAAVNMLEADTGAIVVVEDERKPPTVGARCELSAGLEQLLAGQSFENAALLLPQILNGSALTLSTSDERGTRPEIRRLLVGLRLSWLVSLPLRSGGKVLGALLLGGERPAVITIQDSHWLALIGQQAALALETVRLRKHMWSLAEAIFGQETTTVAPSASPSREPPEDLEALLEAMMAAEEEVQRFNQDLGMLNRLAETLSRSLDPDQVVSAAVDELARALGLEKTWLYLLDEDLECLTLRANSGLSQRYLQARGRLALGEGMEGQVFTSGEFLFVPDVLEAGQTAKLIIEAEGVRAACLAPLRARERVIAVLGGAHDAAHRWTAREVRLFKAMAAQVSLALHNASLYEQVRDAAQAQTMSNMVLQELNRHLLESQAGQQAQLEQLQHVTRPAPSGEARGTALREQVATVMRRLRALCAPEAGPMTPAQQSHAQAMVRELAALAHMADDAGAG